jgi:diaminobutyrate-2-oxoglutarate transaminase
VRGRGMMQGLDVVDGALAKATQDASFQNGLLIGPCGSGGRVIKLIPPLTIPDDDLAEGLDILEKAVNTAVSTAAGATVTAP